jgi:hypothetical protein
MKKLTWMMVLLITMALVVTGCPGGGDDDEKKKKNNNNSSTGTDLDKIFTATEKNQEKATVTVGKGSATFTATGELWGELVMPEDEYWDISGYSGFKFDYKTSVQSTVYLEDNTNTVYVFGWGTFTATDGEWWAKEVSLSTDLEKGWGDGPAKMDLTKVKKFMVGSTDDSSNNKSFEIRNFTAY